jgi:hypothetical protein
MAGGISPSKWVIRGDGCPCTVGKDDFMGSCVCDLNSMKGGRVVMVSEDGGIWL